MKNTFKSMFVVVAMAVALASCGAKEKAADAVDSVALETQAVVDTAAQVVAPIDSALSK